MLLIILNVQITCCSFLQTSHTLQYSKLFSRPCRRVLLNQISIVALILSVCHSCAYCKTWHSLCLCDRFKKTLFKVQPPGPILLSNKTAGPNWVISVIGLEFKVGIFDIWNMYRYMRLHEEIIPKTFLAKIKKTMCDQKDVACHIQVGQKSLKMVALQKRK